MFVLRMFLLRQVRKSDQRSKPLPGYLIRRLPGIFEFLGRKPRLRRAASRLFINSFAYATSPRPRPFSMASDYTTWPGLTDRRFTGRHLPPVNQRHLPAEEDVVNLYRRPKDKETKSTDTSALFTFFAQWFTDSFLRSSRHEPGRNSSNHEIDLCQIYGLSAAKTEKLRSGQGGRLKSQLIDGEEYPMFLEPKIVGDELVVNEDFKGLHRESSLRPFVDAYPEDQRRLMFAVGLEYGNSTIGHTILNTVFLREHNRVADLLKVNYPDWHDERLFQTTRNVMIVLLLKLVVEDYIKHIAPFDFPLEVVPFIAEAERWNRSNWMSIEFDLLYRWHSLVPDHIGEGADRLTLYDPDKPDKNLVNNNKLVISRGIENLVAQMSRERAGRIGLLNTPEFLIGVAEAPTVRRMRAACLDSFNAYRKAFGLKPLTSFEQLTTNTEVRRRLEQHYRDIDDLEWYVGIFAEDYPDYRMMGPLMTTMVAYDAFTQALTNPLLARNVFNKNTFAEVGMDIITDTHSLQQMIARNSKSPGDVYASFRCDPGGK